MTKLLDKMFIDLNDVKRKRRNIIPPSSPPPPPKSQFDITQESRPPRNLFGYFLISWIWLVGSTEERGMLKWKKQISSDTADDKRKRQRVYELPYVTDFLIRHKVFHYIPFLPSFRAFRHKKETTKNTKL